MIGTSGSFNNGGSTIAKVFDGSLTTYFDAPVTSGAWVGLGLSGIGSVIGQINYWPRVGWAGRMLGGVFQGDNTANFSNPVTLYTITVVPPDNGIVTAVPPSPTRPRSASIAAWGQPTAPVTWRNCSSSLQIHPRPPCFSPTVGMAAK